MRSPLYTRPTSCEAPTPSATAPRNRTWLTTSQRLRGHLLPPHQLLRLPAVPLLDEQPRPTLRGGLGHLAPQHPPVPLLKDIGLGQSKVPALVWPPGLVPEENSATTLCKDTRPTWPPSPPLAPDKLLPRALYEPCNALQALTALAAQRFLPWKLFQAALRWPSYSHLGIFSQSGNPWFSAVCNFCPSGECWQVF